MAVSFLGLILIVVVAFCLVILIWRAKKKALILIPFIAIGLLFFFLRVSHVSDHVSSWLRPNSGLVEQVQNKSAIWNEAVADYLEADHYASMEDAARFLGNSLVKDLKEKHSYTNMVVYGSNPVTTRSLTAFSDVVRLQLNLKEVRVESIRPNVLPNDPNLVLCMLDVPRQQNARSLVNGLLINNSSGALRMHIQNPSDIMDHSVEFMEKDWINSLSSVQNSSQSTLMVARSSDSCLDETEAQKQAITQAAFMVQDLLRQANQGQPVLDQEITVTPQDLQTHHFVADQFTQSLRTSAARVWRHAVLLNLDPIQVQDLLREKNSQIQYLHKAWAKDLMSLAGLALVVFILYIFLNAATRGYYAWSLRIMALVTIVGIVVVLLLL